MVYSQIRRGDSARLLRDNRFRLISLGELLVGLGSLLEYWNVPATIARYYEIIRGVPDRSIQSRTLQPGWRDDCLRELLVLQKDCETLGLVVTLPRVRRFQEAVANEDITYAQLGEDAQQLARTFRDELDTRFFLFIPATHAPYFQTPRSGWEDVIDKFPSVLKDVEEAAKCFALDRYTAVAFHLMRVMEIGLRVLAETLNDPNINPKNNSTWQAILTKLENELKKPLKQRSPEWQADELFFSGAAARLMGVKDAWRNPTMHVETAYTEETSLDVLNHVKAFMRHLATKLHECI